MNAMATMTWGELIDGFFWGVALFVSVFLGWLVYRRRDLPARLFLGMVVALAVMQVCQLATFFVEVGLWLFPGRISLAFAHFVQNLWPVDTAALVVFATLTLHLFQIFPLKSRMMRAWRWSPLLFYLPGIFLSLVVLTRPFLGTEGYRTLWALDRLGLGDNTLQILFVILALVLTLARLCLVYFSRATPLVRQQLSWILWGFVVGGSLAVLTDYLPRVTGLPRLAGLVPGLDQLPTLIILGSFALSIIRYHTFDLAVVLNRSVVYAALMLVMTLFYLALATALGGFLRSLDPDMAMTFVAVATTFIVVLVALPLRDAIQRLVDRLFLRHMADYHQLLREYSRVLTEPTTLPRLLATIGRQVEESLHPAGVAIALAGHDGRYEVAFSQGAFAEQPLWQEGTDLAPDHFVPAQLAQLHRAVYVPWHPYDVPHQQTDGWRQVENSGVFALVPMRLRDSLMGWLALGPKRSELAYTSRDLDFLSALADQSCVALENARLCDEMQHRATELAMLAIVSAAISSSLELEHVLETIVESVVQVIGCDKSAIFELNEDGSELGLRMSRGLSEAYVQASLHMPVGQNERTMVVTAGNQLIVADVEEEPALTETSSLASVEGYRAFVETPLVGRDGIRGVLTVYFAQRYMPSANELEMLNTFANQAAIAIENARLYAAVTRERDRAKQLYQQTDAALARRVDELTTIEAISRQLTSTLDLDQVLELVLARGLQATQADRGVISLYEAEKRTLRLLMQQGYPPDLNRYRVEPWPDDRGITGRVARLGVPALVADVSQDPDYVVGSATSCSQLSVPVSYEGAVIGIITLESDRLAAFTAEHLRFAELMADHAAIGINNARLFRAVTEGRDRLEALLNSTHDAVIMLDRAGRAMLINPRVREMLGPAAEQWLRSIRSLDIDHLLQDGLDFFEREDIETLSRLLFQVREKLGQVAEVEFSFEADGQRRYVEGTVSPVFNAARDVVGRVAVLRDVTRRQELEQFREDLTSMVIHNLQGPLAALISSLEILSTDCDDHPEMARELLRIATSSAQKLYERIESVLWIRRLEEKSMPLELHIVPLPGVVEMVADEYRPMAANAGVSLETRFAANLRPVLMDEEMIGRVFSNLLDNALKYTSCGGRIEVRIKRNGDRPQPHLLCTVADTGCGIGPDLIDVIFAKFRRGEGAPQRRRRGMGIGLYFCKLAVEAHGGRIWVESEPGRGTTFSFTLPAVDSES